MQLFLRGFDGETVVVTDIPSLASLKATLGHPEALFYGPGGRPIDSEESFSALPDLASVEVNLPLKGGKVHGSLARAGKVKGQTPKVEAQEKKKKKTGRAKRRIQYNRRFVNVVQTFGRKKGPNSNS